MERDPHAEGLEARLSGQPETANPYDPEEEFDAHCSWNDGWASEDDLA